MSDRVDTPTLIETYATETTSPDRPFRMWPACPLFIRFARLEASVHFLVNPIGSSKRFHVTFCYVGSRIVSAGASGQVDR